ncbi:enterotoxin A family protein [Acinetobacter sp. WZC-1]|uniref:enterotoxin A family protein n=1 Tax=Acinetobacter sp. WZC-1 TaxID=3459034 RepID=UPI00403DB9C9
MKASENHASLIKSVIFPLLFISTSIYAAPTPLQHSSLNTDVELPRYVYRVDSRSPDEIFRDGFTARGTEASITLYAQGGANLANAIYISTTSSPETAESIASSQVNDTYRNAWICDSTGRVQCRSWVYTISPDNTNFFSMADNLPDTEQYRRYFGQHEWVAVDRIYPSRIVSAYPVTRFFDNFVPDGPPVFNIGQARENPNYSSSAEGYVPVGFSESDVGPTRSIDSCTASHCAK